MSKQKPIVHLRVFRQEGNSKDIVYNSEGKPLNENHLVKLEYDTLQWRETIKNLNVFYVIAKVEKVLQPTEEGYEEIKNFSSIEKELQDAFNPTQKRELTPEQKKIADLEAKIDALTRGQAPVKDIDVEDAEIVDDLSEARKEYQDHFGKKGHHSWTAEQIREKIEEDKQKS